MASIEELQDKINIKTSEETPKEFLLSLCKMFDETVNSRESRIQHETIIQMCRKFRGATPSDLFGYWENGVWLDSPKFARLHGTNVFQSLVRAAEASYIQSRVSLDIKAKTNTSRNKRIEEIARAIYEALEPEWHAMEKEIFFSCTLRLNAVVISYFDSTKGFKIKTPIEGKIDLIKPGRLICPSCGYTEEISPDALEGMMGQDYGLCPECGSVLEVMETPDVQNMALIEGFMEETSGKPCTIIADALDVSVDDSNACAGNIEQVSWVQYRRLVHKNKLKRYYPHLQLNYKPKWSYPTALKIGYKKFYNGQYYPQTEYEKNLYEVKQCFIDPALYEDYVSPVDWAIGNFVISQGQALKDICPDGIMFSVVGEEICEVVNENKNRRIKSCVWLSDPTSFYGLGVKAGLQIQKKINQLDNIAMEGEARSMRGSLIYSPHAIDGAKLEGANTNIPLRPEFSTNNNPLTHFVRELEVTGLSAQSLAFLSSQVDTMQRVMGVPDVLLGEGDSRVKTATGQQLVASRAMGLLIPPKRSEAEMKRGWFRDQLDLVQKYMSAAALTKYGTMWGEAWTEEDVQMFFDVDLDEVLNISITTDSEIPETRAEKQSKLRADIQAGLVPLTPEVQRKVVEQSGYGSLDIFDYSSNDNLAQFRYTKLLELAEDKNIIDKFYLVESQNTSDTGIQQEVPQQINPVIEMVLADKAFSVMTEAEQHEQHISFWGAKARKHAASVAYNALFLRKACEAMLIKHRLAQFELSAKQSALGALSQAPVEAGSQVVNAVGLQNADQVINQQEVPAGGNNV